MTERELGPKVDAIIADFLAGEINYTEAQFRLLENDVKIPALLLTQIIAGKESYDS